LLDLIQFGDVVPLFDSVKNSPTIDRHEVHIHDYDRFLSHFNKFDTLYTDLVNEVGAVDDLHIQPVRGTLFHKYKKSLESQETPTTVVTTENIHEVRVVLLGNFATLTKANVSWKCSAFKILLPHFLPVALDRDSAKIFCDDIKAKRNLLPEAPQLSNWLL
jgi:hypothetical protein